VPVNLSAPNPVTGSPFHQFQIRSVRIHHEDHDVWRYNVDDDPDDAEYGPVYFGLYGLDEAELAEHIADRDSYAGAFELAQKLAPGIAFPAEPTLLDSLRDADAPMSCSRDAP
jgi:hypothetical protein